MSTSMHIDLENKRFIFLAGLHRSGTSLIHRVIRDHPEVSGLAGTNAPEDEGQHIQNVYPSAGVFGGPGKFAFHPGARMDENHILVSRENAVKILQSWQPYLELSKQYIVEKPPPNIIRSRFLQALYPKSCFIFIVRHPVAVSYATKKWSKSSITNLLEHTLTAYETAISDSHYLNNFYFVRYEDFVLNPEQESTKIFDLLGLCQTKLLHEIKTDINSIYFDFWKEKREKEQFFKKLYHRKKLKHLEDRMQIFGYSLFEPEKLSPFMAHQLHSPL